MLHFALSDSLQNPECLKQPLVFRKNAINVNKVHIRKALDVRGDYGGNIDS